MMRINSMKTMRTNLFALLTLGAALTLACCSDDNSGGPDAAVDKGPFKNDVVISPDKMMPDKGEPDANLKTMPKIDKILPDNGFANGGKTGAGTRVLLAGKNFGQGATVYMDGKPQAVTVTVTGTVAIQFTMPKNPYGPDTKGKYPPGVVNVGVLVKGQFSNTVRFTYHVTEQATSEFKGSITTTTMAAYADFTSQAISGKVYYKGITDKTTKASDSLGVQLGYGLTGTNPETDDGWRWAKATFSKADSATGYHLYTGKLKVPLKKTYAMAYRFSYDKYGLGDFKKWIYGDSDESDLKYTTAKAGVFTATKAPLGYCQSNTDCLTLGWKVTCKLSSTSWKAHRCVQCLKSSDCTRFSGALGPTCKNEKCTCASDTDCKKNPNGYVCRKATSQTFCGCKKDANCPVGVKCNTKAGLCM